MIFARGQHWQCDHRLSTRLGRDSCSQARHVDTCSQIPTCASAIAADTSANGAGVPVDWKGPLGRGAEEPRIRQKAARRTDWLAAMSVRPAGQPVHIVVDRAAVSRQRPKDLRGVGVESAPGHGATNVTAATAVRLGPSRFKLPRGQGQGFWDSTAPAKSR